MPVSGTAVLVGPRAVWSTAENRYAPIEVPTAALGCIDDDFALVDGQPVDVAGLWREVFSATLDGCASGVLVHPSWWSPRRVERITSVARSVVPTVSTLRRSVVLAFVASPRPSVVAEISESWVALSRPSDRRPVCMVSRAADPATVAVQVVAEMTALAARRGAVAIDRPDGVGGAAQLGYTVERQLSAHGLTVHVIDDQRLRDAAELDDAAPTRTRREVVQMRRRRPGMRAVVGGVAAAGLITGIVLVAGGPTAKRSPTTMLVEGRVAVEVPASWAARRIRAGPGSARVQVTSPADSHVALHVTQTAVPPEETLARTAETLHQALLGQQPGVFVDFNALDSRNGRPAVTYREIRDGHDIVWTVLLDGTVRIAIGCQSAPAAYEAVRTSCERAIASARNFGEISGTVAPQPQSNTT